MNPKLPQEPVVIGEFEKNSKEVVRVSLQQFAGNDVLHIRIFYRDSNGEWKPGRDGITIRAAQFPQLASLLSDAGRALKEIGVI